VAEEEGGKQVSMTGEEADKAFIKEIDAFLDKLTLCSDPGCYQKRQAAHLAAVIYNAGFRNGVRDCKERIAVILENW
jgi:hypothetical protein